MTDAVYAIEDRIMNWHARGVVEDDGVGPYEYWGTWGFDSRPVAVLELDLPPVLEGVAWSGDVPDGEFNVCLRWSEGDLSTEVVVVCQVVPGTLRQVSGETDWVANFEVLR